MYLGRKFVRQEGERTNVRNATNNTCSNTFIQFFFMSELTGARTLQHTTLCGQFLKGHVKCKDWKRLLRSSILSQSLYCLDRESEVQGHQGISDEAKTRTWGPDPYTPLPSTYQWFPHLAAHQKQQISSNTDSRAGPRLTKSESVEVEPSILCLFF